jgi:serine/threonine protein kinase
MPAIDTCPRCSEALPADAPEGLCPECLFRQSVADHGFALKPAADTAAFEHGFVPPAPADLAVHFPQLEILECIGKGGMGAVYRARQPALDRFVAVKILPPEVARDSAFAERFLREARSLARFSHPNIVTIYDFGESGGFCYITMEFVPGRNLRQLLQTGALEQEQMLRIVTQVCEALQYAHDVGVIHRDIKPENILLDEHGRAKIADFGLAKLVDLAPAHLSLTGSHEIMGTVYYMAPEQLLRNVEIDHRADIYSLGVVFYEMLTGELPVGRFAPPGQRARVDSRLDAIVLRALESKPGLRYQDAAELKRDVEAVLGGPETPAAARQSWPCVRFAIPQISWMGAHARGEMYRDETTLILDFSVMNSMGAASHKDVQIPIADVRMISLHKADSPNLPPFVNAWIPQKPEIVIKVKNPAAIARLPAGRLGRGRLRIASADLDAAQQLVSSIQGSPLLGAGAPSTIQPALASERLRSELALLARGFVLAIAMSLFTGALALVVVLRLLSGHESADVVRIVFPAAVLLLSAFCTLVAAGAVHLKRLRNYRVCLAAAFALALPWSPAWPLGVVVGVWAVLVLGRRDVMLAFLGESEPPSSELMDDSEPRTRAAGKIRSLWHSVAGYFVTIRGTRDQSARGEAPERR